MDGCFNPWERCSLQVTILLEPAPTSPHLWQDSYAVTTPAPLSRKRAGVCRQQLPGGERKDCLHWCFSSPYSSNGIPVLAFILTAENHNFASTSQVP